MSKFMWRRGMACQVRISLYASLHTWPIAQLRCSWHAWHITGRNLPNAPGCQRGNHFRPYGLILVALAVEIMPPLRIELFLL